MPQLPPSTRKRQSRQLPHCTTTLPVADKGESPGEDNRAWLLRRPSANRGATKSALPAYQVSVVSSGLPSAFQVCRHRVGGWRSSSCGFSFEETREVRRMPSGSPRK